MQVRHFVSDDARTLETMINDYLAHISITKRHIVPDIKYQMTDNRYSALVIWYPR